jgi:hypothetical protein
MQTVNLNMLPLQARVELIDFYEFLLNKYAPFKAFLAKEELSDLCQPLRLGDLAADLFGTTAGIDLDLPQHPPHKPLELEQ